MSSIASEDGYCAYEEFVQNYISEIGIKDDNVTENDTYENDAYNTTDNTTDSSADSAMDSAIITVPCGYCVDLEGAPAAHTASTYGHAECLEAYLTGHAYTTAPKGKTEHLYVLSRLLLTNLYYIFIF